eukprot:289841-Amorphochlora_amoeboformis.AAC.1
MQRLRDRLDKLVEENRFSPKPIPILHPHLAGVTLCDVNSAVTSAKVTRARLTVSDGLGRDTHQSHPCDSVTYNVSTSATVTCGSHPE